MKDKTDNRKYYEAYDERYKAVHKEGLMWFSDAPSPIVAEIIERYNISKHANILEVGCGEGRDAHHLLKMGYKILATDISPTAINFCKEKWSKFSKNFKTLDLIKDSLNDKYDFIYAVAVIHMLVLDEDRNAFYRFVRTHLRDGGIALICSMGDGHSELKSNIDKAFELQERECSGQKVLVAGTSCRIVNTIRFEEELTENTE